MLFKYKTSKAKQNKTKTPRTSRLFQFLVHFSRFGAGHFPHTLFRPISLNYNKGTIKKKSSE